MFFQVSLDFLFEFGFSGELVLFAREFESVGDEISGDYGNGVYRRDCFLKSPFLDVF